MFDTAAVSEFKLEPGQDIGSNLTAKTASKVGPMRLEVEALSRIGEVRKDQGWFQEFKDGKLKAGKGPFPPKPLDEEWESNEVAETQSHPDGLTPDELPMPPFPKPSSDWRKAYEARWQKFMDDMTWAGQGAGHVESRAAATEVAHLQALRAAAS